MKVYNKKIIVTGAGSGIGRELTLQLLDKGAHVIATDISESGLKETKLLANYNDKLSLYAFDIGDESSIIQFKKMIDKEKIVVDGLINNAGIIQPFINVNDLEMDLINKVMNINFYGPLKLIKLFLPELLLLKEAHIVNISSMGGFFPFPGQTAYGVSKAALKMLTEGLYGELLNTNVHVTAVFPGAIETNIAKNSEVKMSLEGSKKYKMTSAIDTARLIIDGMEKNKFQLYVGNDAKFMNMLYKWNSKKAIKFINKKMGLSK